MKEKEVIFWKKLSIVFNIETHIFLKICQFF